MTSYFAVERRLVEASVKRPEEDEEILTAHSMEGLGETSSCAFLCTDATYPSEDNERENEKRFLKACENGDTSAFPVCLEDLQFIDWLDEKGRNALHLAACNGHRNVVTQLLRYGANVNLVDKNGCTALYKAAANGHGEVVYDLLTSGAYVNMTDNKNQSPLLAAARKGSLNVVRMLLAAGADVNLADKNGHSPLWIAAVHGNTEVVEALLSDATIEIDKANYLGYSPLHVGCRKSELEVMRQLIAAGANVNLADKSGRTPLLIATCKGNAEVVKELLTSEVEVDQVDKDVALYEAARKGKLAVVRLLLVAGANANAATEGRTPLWISVHHGVSEIVQELVTAGAAVNVVCKNETPLFLACVGAGKLEIMQQLLAAGANVNLGDKRGRTPLWYSGRAEIVEALLVAAGTEIAVGQRSTCLHKAARYGKLELVRALLRTGVNVNLADQFGVAPLLVAVSHGFHEVVKVLLAFGAEVNQAHRNGSSPLHKAASMTKLNVVRELLAAGADVNLADKEGESPLHKTVWMTSGESRVTVTRELLAAGADVNLANKRGGTALHIAAYFGHSKAVAELLAAGARINLADNDSITALLAAVMAQYDPCLNKGIGQGHLEVVRLLLAAGADVNLARNDGISPLHACAASYGLSVMTIEELLNAGAYIDVRTPAGKTPLEVACSKANQRIVEILLSRGASYSNIDDLIGIVNRSHTCAGKDKEQLIRFLEEYSLSYVMK